jgi:hypothetical protein
MRARGPTAQPGGDRSELPRLSDGEWKLLEAVAQALVVFREATLPLHAASYPPQPNRVGL